MGASPQTETTNLLLAWAAGDQQVLPKLMEIVYQDLHRAAHRYMSMERRSHTLQTTALIHETYLRLVDQRQLRFEDRTHFLAICAGLMRRVLIDFARSRRRKKRGEGEFHLPLDAAPEVAARAGPDLLAIDEALSQLTVIDERKAKVVELRFFGGLTEEEIAGALNISVETVGRDWRFARDWLRKEMTRGDKRGS